MVSLPSQRSGRSWLSGRRRRPGHPGRRLWLSLLLDRVQLCRLDSSRYPECLERAGWALEDFVEHHNFVCSELTWQSQGGQVGHRYQEGGSWTF